MNYWSFECTAAPKAGIAYCLLSGVEGCQLPPPSPPEADSADKCFEA